GIRPEADLMGEPRCLQPFAAINLVVADDVADAVCEYFGAPSRAGIDTRLLHAPQRLRNGHLAALRKEGDLHHRKRLNVDLWIASLEAAHEVHKVIEGQVRMQAADDVKFRYCFG